MDEKIPMDETSMQAYQVICDFCSALLYSSPNEKSFAELRDQRDLLREEPFATIAPVAATTMADILEAADSPERIDALYHELRQDYAYLFYMVSVSKTSPFESVYRTEDHTLFGPTTLEVRADYARFGLMLSTDESMPDDHIALEFAFLARLFEFASGQSLADGTTVTAAACFDALEHFLSDHLLVFGPSYLANVEDRARTPFFCSLATITRSTLERLADELGVQASASVVE